MTIFGREPAIWVGIIVSCIMAVVGVLSGQGIISDALKGQVTDGVTAVAQLLILFAPIIGAALTRPQVTSVVSPALPAGTTVTAIMPGDTLNYQVTV